MSDYYTILTAISCSILIILSLLVKENDRIENSNKNKFYNTYLFIAAACLCEYLSIALNGSSSSYMGIHSLLKSLDYVLSPVAGLCFVKQVTEKDKLQNYALWLIIINGFLALISNFTGWYFYIDNDNVYRHGPLYYLYVVIYLSILAFTMIEFLAYARRFARKKYVSIFGIWCFITVFIVIQQFVNSGFRVVYLILSISCVMVFAHYCQYRLQESTETIIKQKNLLERDTLTNLYNRYSYNQTLEDYNKQSSIPPELIAISIDINDLKKVNDKLGHQAGDELIYGASQVIFNTFDPYGKCFRTGGDEFIVILNMANGENAKARCNELIASLHTAAASWKGEAISSVSLSCGYAAASDYPNLSLEKLVGIADTNMYKRKEEYHLFHNTHC